MNNKHKGLYFEQQALEWLRQQGLKLVEQNYHCRFGEIDLIMLEQDQLCFIEVKYRNSNAFGGAAYSIPTSKQQKIQRSALSFINQYQQYQQHGLRFDALLIQDRPGQQQQKIEWIPNAFDAGTY